MLLPDTATSVWTDDGPPGRALPLQAWPSPDHQRGAQLRLKWRRLPGLLNRIRDKAGAADRGDKGAASGGDLRVASEAIFTELFGWQEDTFWLDR